MKTYVVIAMILIGWPAPWMLAQPPHPRTEHDRFRDEGPGGRPPASPIRLWMRQLRDEDPAMFERLQRLRWQDPAAFRVELSQYMMQNALRRMEAERPRVYQAIMALSPEDREWIARKLARPEYPPPPMFEGMESERPEPPPSRRQQIKELVEQYHQAISPEEKAATRARLAEEIDREYDQRIMARRRQLEKAEEKLRDLRAWLERGEREKEAFIREKLSVWLDEAE